MVPSKQTVWVALRGEAINFHLGAFDGNNRDLLRLRRSGDKAVPGLAATVAADVVATGDDDEEKKECFHGD